MLSKYWKEVTEHRFSGVKYTDPRDFNNRWYEERNTEIARVKKEGDARSKALNKPWQEVADLGKSVKLEMVLIPAGTFLMGSDGPDPEELPHEVTITKCFYFGKYAVTQEQWAAVMGNNLSRYKGPKLPITNVSWNDCQEFIKKLNASTKGGYRLPTEAEWEYVCKAGTMSFGDEIGPEDANCADSGIDKPIEVGSYRPNPFGLYDMYGNVREWCEDRYQVYYYFYYDAVTDPKGPASGKRRVLRGGSFSTDFVELDRAERIDLSPASRDSHNGFRLVRTI
jgi:formylglycine-generating enzyme required for sulfatase activity